MLTLPTLPDADSSRAAEDPCKAEAGFGALRTPRGLLPLEALDVDARLDGLIASVEVRQTFVNAHAEPLEATYIFPLPDRAAVTGFRLEVAGRVVEGELQERGQARQRYDEAVQAGHRAALAEEERPGVFTMRVGNLRPGERAHVRLTLAGPLPYRDGEVTFRFPLVVAPRYIPGAPLSSPPVGAGTAPDTYAVPDASRISPPVLLPGFASPVRLSLSVEVAPSPLAPGDFRSSLHTVEEIRARSISEGQLSLADASGSGGPRRFRLHPGEKLDRDFLLRYRVGADEVRTGLVVRPDEAGDAGTFLLTLVPPAHAVTRQRPRDVVFVLDRSGSMAGWKMVAARRAVSRMVETLTDEDRFTIFAFDDRIETPPGFDGLALVPGSDRRRFQAAEFLAGVTDRGGTEMAEPLYRAVEALSTGGANPDRDRVLVLITDGQVGNEDQILRRLGERARAVRIFTLGIDQAVNAGFLRRLADLGGGASEVVESEARLDEVMDSVHRHVGTAVLSGLELRAGGLDVIAETVVPSRLPDLFAGSPVLISGRYRGRAGGAVALHGRDADGRPWSAESAARLDGRAPLAAVWARGRVRELEDRYAAAGAGADRAKLEREIVETSLRFGVLSRFTAFVAVDASEVVNEGGRRKQIVQPVESPAGWGEYGSQTLQSAPGAAAGAMRGLLGAAPPSIGYRAPAPRYARASSGREGLLSRLLSAVRGPAKSGDAAEAVDRTPFRTRVEGLLAKLRAGGAGDVASRLAALRGIYADLKVLVGDLSRAGALDAALARLAALTAGIPKLTEDAAVDRHYREVEEALAAWLQGAPGAFWK